MQPNTKHEKPYEPTIPHHAIPLIPCSLCGERAEYMGENNPIIPLFPSYHCAQCGLTPPSVENKSTQDAATSWNNLQVKILSGTQKDGRAGLSLSIFRIQDAVISVQKNLADAETGEVVALSQELARLNILLSEVLKDANEWLLSISGVGRVRLSRGHDGIHVEAVLGDDGIVTTQDGLNIEDMVDRGSVTVAVVVTANAP